MGVIWRGVKEFEQGLVNLDVAVQKAAVVAGTEAGAELALVLEADAPKGKTHRLASSIFVRATVAGGLPLVQVGPTAIYGRRNDLGFKGRRSARGVRARRAAGIDTGRRGLQPTRASHFVERGLTESLPRLGAIYRSAWADAITKF